MSFDEYKDTFKIVSQWTYFIRAIFANFIVNGDFVFQKSFACLQFVNFSNIFLRVSDDTFQDRSQWAHSIRAIFANFFI